jgi:hypothetical protein
MYVFEITVLCVYGTCAPFGLFNQLADFHEIWCKHYAIRGKPNTRHYNFLQLVTAVQWKCELQWHTQEFFWGEGGFQ